MTQTATPAAPATRLGAGYWRLWWANTVSSTGDGAFAAALPLLAVTVTRDPRLVAVVTAATYLPWLLFSLPAGAVVDRRDRAALMYRSQAVQAAVVAVLAVLIAARRADIEVLAAAGLLLGSAEVMFGNAAQSVLPALVPPDLLPKANGSQQVSLTVGESFLGPPVGSLLFAAAAALPFGLDAASFASSAALLAGLPESARARPGHDGPGIRAQIAEGLRWLARHRLLRVVAVLLGIYNFANQMGQAVLVLLATQTLHVSARGYGLLLAASAVGSVVGGLVNPVLCRRLGLLPALVLPAMIDAAAFVGVGLAPDPAAAAALLAVQGFAVTMWNVVTVSLRQRIVPAHLLGRVNSVYRMLGWGLMPAGALAGGFVAHAAGLRAPCVLAGLLCALSALAALPLLRAAIRAPGARDPLLWDRNGILFPWRLSSTRLAGSWCPSPSATPWACCPARRSTSRHTAPGRSSCPRAGRHAWSRRMACSSRPVTRRSTTTWSSPSSTRAVSDGRGRHERRRRAASPLAS
jgi:MFS family permease